MLTKTLRTIMGRSRDCSAPDRICLPEGIGTNWGSGSVQIWSWSLLPQQKIPGIVD